MNNSEILSVLKDLYTALGLCIALYNKDLTEIAAYPDSDFELCTAIQKNAGAALCADCGKLAALSAEAEKKPIIYKLSCGLCISVCPLYSLGELWGFVFIGPVIEENENTDLVLSELQRLPQNGDDAKIALNSAIALSKDKIEVYSRLITLCVKSLTVSDAVSRERLTVAEATKKYVIENYGGKIRISDLCHELGCSKSTLLSAFKREYGVTIGDFITDYRLIQAKKLLENENFSINEIANKTGFYDQAYFSKVFSAKCEKSPSEYRRVAKFGERSEK